MTAIKVDKKPGLLNFNLSRCTSIVSQTNSNAESTIKMEAIKKETESAAKIQEANEQDNTPISVMPTLIKSSQ